ncbi:hypothetical protein LCGC14_0341060 [marine sediment metagenome]|uniref:NAD(P)-binding domain-containing protein n=1 Tax=marine sediment metagenome TaxID=412755 RepID=A0A0F9TJ91_9ZZZZ
MRILVTGGCGFIGSHFVKHLFENPDCNIIVLDALTYAGNTDNIPEQIKADSRFSFWYGNICNADLINELVAKSDIVVHFAAESHVARSIYDNTIFFQTDVLGTQVIANAVLKHINTVERFIHISTSEVYGTALEVPMTEEHPLNPLTPYASAKTGADRLVYSYYKTYGIPAIILRLFNVYGANQHLEKVIPRFITSALLDEPLTIHGTGESTRDWNYVEDVCKAIGGATFVDLEKLKGQVINIGTGKEASIVNIAEVVLDILNKPKSLITHIVDRYGQVKQHKSSTDKALRLLNWQATMEFSIGLNETIEWYKQNPDWWKRLLWMRQVATKTREGGVEYY